MSKKHETLSSLILTGEPGDWYHDMPRKGERCVETYILRYRQVIDFGLDAGVVRGHFENIRTWHYGKAELAGRPEYQDRTTWFPHRAETREGSPFVRHHFDMSGGVRAVGPATDAKRYNRTKILQIHQRALKALGYDLPGVE